MSIMAFSASTSLSVTLNRAISFLTQPLKPSHAPEVVLKLKLLLESSLGAHYSPTWVPEAPLSGSGKRCLTLSPSCLPPRAIHSACMASGVQWFSWIALLGGREFDFFVDPGCVSIRLLGAQTITIWADEVPSPAPKSFRKTLAQQLIEDDSEEEELFTLIADEISAPTWMTPVADKFPISHRSTSPLSVISAHSRSSSRSSSSGNSFSSVETPPSSLSGKTQSRRDRARHAAVFVDKSKTEVTPYDGGKTTVLTGGVMLGGSPKGKPRKATESTDNWRADHA